ncbi:type II toxin-antitoxin system antitoxin HipB [Aliivibrio fischeri]|uniref:type II toxin-antitoxin system antitoxin HipB n=1 Tax=Aliivibrio fischeri TaxID=668 RepID=UPI0012D9E7E3|nr:type II toxin-antitoxin system antitoxin HipB [Aliivibrio fischeri]MUJ23578.1 type II toxin-antitoxin system antitoxin HipB [Aliivibrio fischeri]MUK25711.1 type II toxin-antitoxin system antitoxin HipB [Aliivibrio fischeri]MUK34324.1 type II toxin-antitoxin system antitoxin HipB [Aliivibrio fischeri]
MMGCMMIYNPKQLANHLKLIRTKHNLTQTELAKKVGVKQSTLSSFENHPETTQLQTLFKILHALEVHCIIQEQVPTSQEDNLDDEAW